MSGRFAPSPTGRLHLGNLRTAAIGWLAARSAGIGHLVRMEDLDRVTSSVEHERQQLADLETIGIDWDGEVVRQSERFERYDAAIDRLTDLGLVYECFCTRREIRAEIEASVRAPHVPPDAYPGTCRRLTARRRSEHVAGGRPAALRLRAMPESDHDDPPSLVGLDDLVCGRYEAVVDDVVLRRNDGVPSYNVAVVVDDAAQGVAQVVRGDDLLSSTPRQIHLQQLLDLSTPEYAHVPLVLGADGERLAKRHGSVTLAELASDDVVRWILGTLGEHPIGNLDGPRVLDDLLPMFDVTQLRNAPVTVLNDS